MLLVLAGVIIVSAELNEIRLGIKLSILNKTEVGVEGKGGLDRQDLGLGAVGELIGLAE